METKTKINYVVGDATEPVGDGLKIIAHCCNDMGAWGAGFVMALSKKWQEPEAEYRRMMQHYGFRPYALGDVRFVPVGNSIIVANIIGQHSTGYRFGMPAVRYEALEVGFRWIAAYAGTASWREISVHMPRLGAGLAGGKWEIIEGLIDQELCAKGIQVTVYDLPEGR